MRVIRFKEFADEDEHISWLVEGLLPDTGWSVLTGEQGVGKTRFALQLSDALQRGVPFLGMATQQTKCMLMQVDSVVREWREIVREVIPKSNALTVIDVPEFWIEIPKCTEWFQKVVDQVHPGYIIFDSLYKIASDINNSNAIGPRIAQLKQLCKLGDFDIPWLMLHHPPQNETRAAGSRSIVAAASYTFELTPTQLKITKGRLTKKGTIPLEMDEKGIWHSYGEGEDEGGTRFDALIHDPLL